MFMTDSNQNQNETLNNGADAWQNPNGAYPFPPSDSTANDAENDPYKANGYQNVPPYSAMPYPTFTPPATATPVEETKKSVSVLGIVALIFSIIGVLFFVLPWFDLLNLMNKWNAFKALNTLDQNMAFMVACFAIAFSTFLCGLIMGAVALKKEAKTAMGAIAVSGLLIIPALSFTFIFAFTQSITKILL